LSQLSNDDQKEIVRSNFDDIITAVKNSRHNGSIVLIFDDSRLNLYSFFFFDLKSIYLINGNKIFFTVVHHAVRKKNLDPSYLLYSLTILSL
jgi:hypothetical protein